MHCYPCEICNMFNKPKNNTRHFKSNTHKNLDKHNYKKLTNDCPNIDDIDKLF